MVVKYTFGLIYNVTKTLLAASKFLAPSKQPPDARATRVEQSQVQTAELAECFALIDQDESGAIGLRELEEGFKVLGVKISRAQVARMVEQVDRDGSGEVEFPEFVELMTSKLGMEHDTHEGGAVSAYQKKQQRTRARAVQATAAAAAAECAATTAG
eukprot:CAMPEP_0197608334 /NCGR_PEP_ID=MMETSP1326-20131121/48867_1 /TAXON_ID=1155430 /ORGANISM="Genus nov. species nov., Strain RCC2288" /LENGTH=156 /DNA_ID=CAMNT_0043176519 /DNA_START=306 /DNA_END=772 /DNA_ORIENTATION=+